MTKEIISCRITSENKEKYNKMSKTEKEYIKENIEGLISQTGLIPLEIKHKESLNDIYREELNDLELRRNNEYEYYSRKIQHLQQKIALNELEITEIKKQNKNMSNPYGLTESDCRSLLSTLYNKFHDTLKNGNYLGVSGWIYSTEMAATTSNSNFRVNEVNIWDLYSEKYNISADNIRKLYELLTENNFVITDTLHKIY